MNKHVWPVIHSLILKYSFFNHWKFYGNGKIMKKANPNTNCYYLVELTINMNESKVKQ
jgi:hypothetical protein